MPCRRSRVRISFPAHTYQTAFCLSRVLISPLRFTDIAFRTGHSPVCFWLVPLLLFFLSSSCTRQDFSGTHGSSPASGPSRESWNVQIVLSQADSEDNESRTRLILSADHVQWSGEQDSTIQHLRGVQRKVEIEMYDSLGVMSAFLEADRVSHYKNEEYFVAEGRVRIATSDNRILTTERVEWWEREQLLRTESFVRIRTPEEVVSGTGLQAREDLSSYQIGPFAAEIARDP